MDSQYKLIAAVLGESRVKRDVDITAHLNGGWGGRVRFFYIATTVSELVKSVGLCRDLGVRCLIIGSGSKIVLSSSDFEGLVIKNKTSNIRITAVKGKASTGGIGVEEATVEAESGVSLVALGEFARQHQLVGLELFLGKSGTLGGCLYLDRLLQRKVFRIKVLEQTGKIIEKDPQKLQRTGVILTATFRLHAA